MAKRLNKNLIVTLTFAGMLVTAVIGIILVMNLPKKDPEPVARQAEELAERGEYEQATRFYQKAARRAQDGDKPTPESNKYLILAGDTALHGGSARRALGAWSQVVLNDPQHEQAYEKIVKLYLELATLQSGGGTWPRVQQEAEKLCQINEHNYVGLHAWGRSLIAQRVINEQYAKQGRDKLIEAVNGDKSNPEYANSLAMDYFREGQIEESTNVYDELINELTANPPEDPKDVASSFRYRGQFYLGKRTSAWQQLYRRQIEGAGPGEQAELKRKVTGPDEKALGDLEEALRQAPQDVEILIALGDYWQGKPPVAVPEADRESVAKGFRARAKEYYEQAVRADPDHYVSYLKLAGHYLNEHKYDEGMKVLDERRARPAKRDHYLGWRNIWYMALVRDEAFNVVTMQIVALPKEIQDSKERERQFKELIDKLEELCDQAAAEAPKGEKDSRVLYMRGRILMLQGDKSGAIKAFVESEKQSVGVNIDLRRMLAGLYAETGSPGLADEMLRGVLAMSPDDMRSFVLLAGVQNQLNKPDQAIAYAERVLRVDPKHRHALSVLAQAYQRQGNYEALREVQRRLIAEDEGSSQAKLSRVFVLLAENNSSPKPELVEEAEQLLREVLQADPLSLQALQYLVTLLADQNRHADIPELLSVAKAVVDQKSAEEATATQPSDERKATYANVDRTLEILTIYADPQATKEEKYKRAEEAIKRGDDPYRVAVSMYYMCSRGGGREDEAYEYLKKAYELKPDDPGIVERVFRLALPRKDWKQAEDCIDIAIGLNMDPSGGHFYRGRLLLARKDLDNNFAEAAEELRAGLSESPSYAEGHVWLGYALLATKNYEEAKRAFLRAHGLSPRNASAAIGLASVASSQGNQADKEKYLAICAELAPNHAWVKAELQNAEDRRDPKRGIARREEQRKEEPENIENLLRLAELYADDGQSEKAKAIYGECRKIEPISLRVANVYAKFLCAKMVPPELDVAEQMLRELLEKIDPKDGQKKAAAQLLIARHWHYVAVRRQGQPGTPTRAEVDAAYEAAASFSDSFGLCWDIGSYFMEMERYDKAEEWFRKGLEIAQEKGGVQDQKKARTYLIDALIQEPDEGRVESIQKEIDSFHDQFPGDPFSLLAEGEFNNTLGRNAKAVELFTAYIDKVPDSPMGYFRRGSVHFKEGRWEQVANDCRESKRLSPAFYAYEPRIMLAQALDKSGQAEAAIAELQSLLQEDVNVVRVVEQLFAIYTRLQRWGSAESLIKSRMQQDPDNPVWWRLLAQIGLQRDEADPAIRFALETAQQSGFAPRPLDVLLRTYLDYERFDELIAFFNDELPEDKRTGSVPIYVASAYAGKQNVDKAIEWYVRYYEAPGARPDMFSRSFNSNLQSHLDIDEIVKLIDKRLAANPDERVSRLMAAQLQRYRGDEKGYIQAIQDLLAKTSGDDPKSVLEKIFFLRTLADLMHQQKQFAESRKYYEEILKLNPDDVLALNSLAFLLMNSLNDIESALAYARQAAEKSRYAPQMTDVLLVALLRSGQFDELLDFVNRQISAERRTSLVLLRMASAHAGKGKVAEAIRLYTRFFSDPDARLEMFASSFKEDIDRGLGLEVVLEEVNKRLASNSSDRGAKFLLAVIKRLKGDSQTYVQLFRELLATASDTDTRSVRQKMFFLRKLALAMYLEEQFQECAGLNQELLKLSPHDVRASNDLAYVLMEKLNDPQQALAYSKQAAEKAGENAAVLDTLGWNLVLVGNYNEGIARLRRSLQVDKTLAPAYYHLAEGYFRRSQAADAKNPQADRREAQNTCQQAHELIMKAGINRYEVLDKIVALGEKLGMNLSKEFPKATPAKP